MALADGDSSFIINGGAGWMFGTPPLMQPFLREYRALPAVQFQPWDKAKDPVAIWFHKLALIDSARYGRRFRCVLCA